MNWDVSVSLFISVVLLDIVKIISSNDDGSVHFCGDDNTPMEEKKNIFIFELMYLTIFPRMDTYPVNGHFLSI